MDNLGHAGVPSGVVEDVVVRLDWREKGGGRKMMEEAMSSCAAKRCYKLALTTNKSRHSAHLFYETLGFDLHGFSYCVPVGPKVPTAEPKKEVASGVPL